MRVLVVGAGGVGSAFAHIAARRGNFEKVVIADYDGDRAHKAAQSAADHFSGVQLDASDESSITELLRTESCDAVLNAVDPRFVMPIYRAALAAGVTYLDMAMSLSHPHPEEPYSKTGVKLGDEQFELAPQWEERGLLALAGMGVEPGLSDVFARHAADKLFSSIDELGVRDGANLVVEGYDFCPTFSIWTTIEECLNPPVIWEKDRGWFTTEPFSEPETFVFPAGIGPVECVNVEHEEVLLMPALGGRRTASPSSTVSGTSSSACSRRSTCSASTRPSRSRSAGPRCRLVTSSPRASPTRPRSAISCTASPVPAPG